MLVAAQFIASFCCTVFAGAALYINLVEHPARLACGTSVAATVWAPSYRRATVMQAPLAILSFVAGACAWWLGGGLMWLIAALLIGTVVPVTFVIIMPTNERLLDPARDPASGDTLGLLIRWGWLHGIRSILSLSASLIYLALLLRG